MYHRTGIKIYIVAIFTFALFLYFKLCITAQQNEKVKHHHQSYIYKNL